MCNGATLSPPACPRRRSRHKQLYSDQPRFRCASWGRGRLLRRIGGPRGWAALKRCTATASSGLPGAQVQRSCTFAPGNPGLGSARSLARSFALLLSLSRSLFLAYIYKQTQTHALGIHPPSSSSPVHRSRIDFPSLSLSTLHSGSTPKIVPGK